MTAAGGLRYRPATSADTRSLFDTFLEAVAEIDRRVGSADALDTDDPAAVAAEWDRRRPIFEHLAVTADLAWLAETSDGHVAGYARSIVRDGVRELTEFFVRPGHQGGGIGGELLRRAFPAEGARHRSIIATLELPALVRYLKTGLTARSLLAYVSARPRRLDIPSDLVAEQVTPTARTLASLARIDRRILGHSRPVDHRWLLGDREGRLYRRAGRVVGYGYVGGNSGPVAVLDTADTAAVLADLETRAAESGLGDLGFWLPTVNREAAMHLLDRGFRLDQFLATYFSDDDSAQLDRYLVTSPPFFV